MQTRQQMTKSAGNRQDRTCREQRARPKDTKRELRFRDPKPWSPFLTPSETKARVSFHPSERITWRKTESRGLVLRRSPGSGYPAEVSSASLRVHHR